MHSRLQKLLARRRRWFSQFGQDRYLDREIFAGKRGGRFVEAGAFDGLRGSNTAFFERERGWHGLLIEASPELAKLAARHRTSPCRCVALAAETGSADFIEIRRGYRMMSGLRREYPPQLLETVRLQAQHDERQITVPTRPLQDVLREAELTTVDLISLDIEGAELAVLEVFPFDAFQVDVWCIENNQNNPALEKLMTANGYRLNTRLGVDEIYTGPDFYK